MNLPVEEARKRLLDKTKEDKMEIQQAEQKLSEIKKIIDAQTKQLKDLEANIEEKKTDFINPQKMEQIMSQEKIMDQYIEGFDKTK